MNVVVFNPQITTSGIEIVSQRTEKSKTFDLGNGTYVASCSIYPLHYKNNYSDKKEQWKDINLSYTENNTEYTITNGSCVITIYKTKLGYNVKSKKTQQEFQVLLNGKNIPSTDDIDFVFHIFPSRIRLWKIVKRASAIPILNNLVWNIKEKPSSTGTNLIFRQNPEICDANNGIPELLTEKTVIKSTEFTWKETLTGECCVDGETEKLRVSKELEFPINIDVDVDEDVGATADTAYFITGGSYWLSPTDRFNAGTFNSANVGYGAPARFTTVNIPQGATINSASFSGTCSTSFTGTDCRTKIDAIAEDNPSGFSGSSYANFMARARTTAKVDWDISSVWAVGSIQTSPDISTVIQEIVNRSGWVANNSMVIVWSDDGSPDTANNLRRMAHYNHATYNPPHLDISYTAAPVGTGVAFSGLTYKFNFTPKIANIYTGSNYTNIRHILSFVSKNHVINTGCSFNHNKLVINFNSKIHEVSIITSSPVTIISSVGTLPYPTNVSQNRKLIYDGSNYWVFYQKSSTPNTLFYSYSSNLSTWTEASTALAGTTLTDGGAMDVLFWTNGTDKVVLVTYYTNTNPYRYLRGTISGTDISWSSNTNYIANDTKHATSEFGVKLALPGNNKPLVVFPNSSNASPNIYNSNTVISTDFAPEFWVNSGYYTANDYMYRAKILPRDASTDSVLLVFNTTDTEMFSVGYSSGSFNEYAITILDNVAANVRNWDVCSLSTSSFWFLGQLTANSFYFASYTGEGWSWTDKTAPTWPSGNLATNAGISLSTDGTDIWAVTILGDENNSVSYNKYTVADNSWGGWTESVISTKTRSQISICGNNISEGILPTIWTEENGSNYDIVVTDILNSSSATGVNYQALVKFANFKTKIHSIATGCNYNSNKKIINFSNKSHNISIGSNFIHNKQIFNFQPKNHSVSVGASFTHTTTILNFSSKVHSVAVGTSFSSLSSYIDFLVLNHSAGHSAVFNHNKIYALFDVKNHSISTGTSFSHLTQIINFKSSTSTVGFSSLYSHLTSLFTLTPKIHLITTGTSFNSVVNNINFVSKNHIISTGCSFISSRELLDFKSKVHLVSVGSSFSSTTNNILFNIKNHVVSINVLFNTNTNKINFINKTHQVLLGVNHNSSVHNINFVSKFHNISVGSSFNNTTSFITFISKTHSVSTGSYISNNIKIINFISKLHSITCGCSYTNVKSILYFNTKIHSISTGCSYTNTKQLLSLISKSHNVAGGCNYIQTKKTFLFIIKYHNVILGYNCFTTTKFINFNSKYSSVNTGVNISQLTKNINFIIGHHEVVIGNIIVQTTTLINFLSKTHLTNLGINYNSNTTYINFISKLQLVNVGSSYIHNKHTFNFITKLSSVDIGSAILHDVKYINFIVGQHNVIIGSAINHLTSTLSFISKTHQSILGVNYNSSNKIINFISKTHTINIGYNYIQNKSIISFLSKTSIVSISSYYSHSKEIINFIVGQHQILTTVEILHITKLINFINKTHIISCGSVYNHSLLHIRFLIYGESPGKGTDFDHSVKYLQFLLKGGKFSGFYWEDMGYVFPDRKIGSYTAPDRVAGNYVASDRIIGSYVAPDRIRPRRRIFIT